MNFGNRKERQKKEEMSEDLKNDLLLSFNLFKNSRDKLTKLKLRSMLFSFAMYKSAASDINKYIDSVYPKCEEFSFEDLCNLVLGKISIFQERDFEDTWSIIASNPKNHTCTFNELVKALEGVTDATKADIDEMILMINEGTHHEERSFSKEGLKKFLDS